MMIRPLQLLAQHKGPINCSLLVDRRCTAGHFGGVPSKWSCLTCPHRVAIDATQGASLPGTTLPMPAAQPLPRAEAPQSAKIMAPTCSKCGSRASAKAKQR